MPFHIRPRYLGVLAAACVVTAALSPAFAMPPTTDWRVLSDSLDAFQKTPGTWFTAADARVAPANDRRLIGEPGSGVLINGPDGVTDNLVTNDKWGDTELALEFLIPTGSNSGVKLHGVYEIQIIDSYQATELSGNVCGGIYPRAEFEQDKNPPKYYHIDNGIAPAVNAAKAPGEWQTLHLIFRAPRFGADGKKIANARFQRVELNGKLIHDNVEVPYPTGHIWRDPEHAVGPLLFQGDHGPVAYRNVRVRTAETDAP